MWCDFAYKVYETASEGLAFIFRTILMFVFKHLGAGKAVGTCLGDATLEGTNAEAENAHVL